MPEQVYNVEGQYARFADGICPCLFLEQMVINAETVRSLAILGAAVCLAHQGRLPRGKLPYCLPGWVQEGINRYVRKGE